MQLRQASLVLVAAATLALAACDRGATTNANAPGSPGTGNGVDVSKARVGESTTAQGSTGAKGTKPSPGSPASEAPVGTSGYGGTGAMGGPGTGLSGGMNPAPGQPTGVAEGTTNSTAKNNVGKRY